MTNAYPPEQSKAVVTPPRSPSLAERVSPWVETAKQQVQRGSRITGLEPTDFVLVGGGALCMVLLLLSTLLTWYSYVTEQTFLGSKLAEGTWYRGISYAEGKLV